MNREDSHTMREIPSENPQALHDLQPLWLEAQDLLNHATAIKFAALMTQDPVRKAEILAEHATMYARATALLDRYWTARNAART